MFSFGNQLLGRVDEVVGALEFRSEGRWFEVQSLPSCCFLRQETLPHFVSLHPGVYKCRGSRRHDKRSWSSGSGLTLKNKSTVKPNRSSKSRCRAHEKVSELLSSPAQLSRSLLESNSVTSSSTVLSCSSWYCVFGPAGISRQLTED